MKRIYDVGYSRISEAFEAALKNRPFGEKPADSAGRLHRLWARWPGGAGKKSGHCRKNMVRKKSLP